MHSITWPISKGLYDTGGAKRHSWDPQDDLDNGYNGYVRIHSQTLNTFDLCDPLLNIFQSQWFYAVDDSEARVTGWWQKGHCANGRASNFQFQWRLQIPGPETWTLSEAGQDRRNDHQEFRKTYFDMAIIYIYILYIILYVIIKIRRCSLINAGASSLHSGLLMWVLIKNCLTQENARWRDCDVLLTCFWCLVFLESSTGSCPVFAELSHLVYSFHVFSSYLLPTCPSLLFNDLQWPDVS